MIIYNKEISTNTTPYTSSIPPKYILSAVKPKITSSRPSSLSSHSTNNLTESNINFLKSLNFQLKKQ